MTYFLLIILLFNRPGDIRDIIHIETIHGEQKCISIMNNYRERDEIPRIGMKDIPKGAILSCVPLRIPVDKTSKKESV